MCSSDLVTYPFIWAIIGVPLLVIHGLLKIFGGGLPWAWLFRGDLALVLHLAIITLLAYDGCQQEIIKERQKGWTEGLEELKKLNAQLQFAVNALKQGQLVKVSLKSRKVYIGIIAGDHFEHNDLEYITLIPYFSGHRDKDTLRLQLSRSYLDSYRQLDLIPRPEDSPTQRQQRLEGLNHFRLNLTDRKSVV